MHCVPADAEPVLVPVDINQIETWNATSALQTQNKPFLKEVFFTKLKIIFTDVHEAVSSLYTMFLQLQVPSFCIEL